MFNFSSKKSVKLELFVRHCFFSEVSAHKKRPPFFDRRVCHENLLRTLDPSRVNVTFFLDNSFQKPGQTHFVKEQNKYKVVEIFEGTEAGSFLQMLSWIEERKFTANTILYFVEDDYLHREGWVDVLCEGFSLPGIDYVTLYDHGDKYTLSQYEALQSRIFHTQSCHWRTTPSTTNTYAMTFETLMAHLRVHKQFSLGRKITEDHGKFCHLREKGSLLISPMPGWATHVEDRHMSPCLNWEKVCENFKIR